jgi:hypothetical protein
MPYTEILITSDMSEAEVEALRKQAEESARARAVKVKGKPRNGIWLTEIHVNVPSEWFDPSASDGIEARGYETSDDD